MTQGSGGAAGRWEGRGAAICLTSRCQVQPWGWVTTAQRCAWSSVEACECRAACPRARPCLQASSAYKHSLKEVLTLPAIASKIKDTKATREVQALQVRMPPAVCRGRGLLLRCMQCIAPVVFLYCPCTAQRIRTALH